MTSDHVELVGKLPFHLLGSQPLQSLAKGPTDRLGLGFAGKLESIDRRNQIFLRRVHGTSIGKGHEGGTFGGFGHLDPNPSGAPCRAR